jgi:integrase
MSTGFVPSSVSTVCVTRQPWAAAKSRHFCPRLANERKVFGLHASSGIGGLAVLLRQGAVHGSAGFRRSEDLGRRGLPVVLTPDEVVRILGFLEGEHRLFAQLLYGTGMRISEGLQLRVKDLDFDHGTIIVRGGQGLQDRALMLPESLAPSLREQLSRARAWWLKDRGRGRSGVALPDALERKYPRAGHSPRRGSGFCAAHAFDRSTGGVVRRHHMYDQTFQRAFKRAVEGTVAKLAMRQPFVLFKGLTFQKTLLTGRISPGGSP